MHDQALAGELVPIPLDQLFGQQLDRRNAELFVAR
jgi:hypothetical protein